MGNARVDQDKNGAHLKLAQALIQRHPDMAAAMIDTARVEEAVALLGQAAPESAAAIVKRLTPDAAAGVVQYLPPEAARRFLTVFDPNRSAALLARLDPEVGDERLGLLDPKLATEIRALMEYPRGSAGQLMDPRVTAFGPEASVRDVIRKLRSLRTKGIQDVFLVDDDGKLVGAVPLQDVVLASSGDRLSSLATGAPPSVQALAPRDEVMEVLGRHGPGSLAVVDIQGRLLGVLRQQELIAAAQRDATSGLVTMVGAGKEERALSSPLFAVKKRLPWLEINLLTAFLAASVVGVFESTIAQFTALAVLLPVVAGQSGNTGAQALAVTMRGLALREVRVRHWLKVAGKELAVGSMNGVAVALTTAGAVYIWSRSVGLALVICVSMVVSMTIAGLAGAAIPMMLTALRQDPAQSSSIILTTVTDVVGFFSFLGIATLCLSLL